MTPSSSQETRRWRCLDCHKTWTGPAGEIVVEGRRKTLQLTSTGIAIREHVLRFEHAAVPTSSTELSTTR